MERYEKKFEFWLAFHGCTLILMPELKSCSCELFTTCFHEKQFPITWSSPKRIWYCYFFLSAEKIWIFLSKQLVSSCLIQGKALINRKCGLTFHWLHEKQWSGWKNFLFINMKNKGKMELFSEIDKRGSPLISGT